MVAERAAFEPAAAAPDAGAVAGAALFWRLLVPRFVKLCWLLTHIPPAFAPELTLLAGELIRVHDFAAGGWFRWRTQRPAGDFPALDNASALPVLAEAHCR